jgi:hypothetical protein
LAARRPATPHLKCTAEDDWAVPHIQTHRDAPSFVEDKLAGWLATLATGSEVVGSDQVQIERVQKQSDPLRHVQSIESTELRLYLRGGAVLLALELLELGVGEVRHLSAVAVGTSKPDLPVGASLPAPARLNEVGPAAAAGW